MRKLTDRQVKKLLLKQNNCNPPAKVLLFDIETLPIVSYHWGMFKQYINHNQIINDWIMLSWSAKWLFDYNIYSDILTPREAIKRHDKRISKSLWKLLDEADVVVAHNLKKFDKKRSQTRFKINGLNPPSPYQLIDTLEQSRKEFSFSSNRLDYLGKIMVNHQKLDTDFELWRKCDNGDKSALKLMDEYCCNDVVLLEEVYLELRAWIKSHPNLNVYGEGYCERCPSCSSEDIKYKGYYGTPSGRYASFQCYSCGTYGRSRYSDLSKEEKSQLTTSIAR